jgi:hypothetical protein
MQEATGLQAPDKTLVVETGSEVKMDSCAELFLFFLVGVVGGLLGARLNLPGGTLVGAMLGVIICKLFTQSRWVMPESVSFITQVLIGIMAASTFQPAMLKTLKSIALPVAFSSLALMFMGGLLAIFISRLKLLDPVTAYIATSPGAMVAMVPLSTESCGNPLIVTCFHFFRLLFIVLTAPWILKALSSLAK